MSDSENIIEYQGRKAHREGSEIRRRKILEAALRVVVREGVRGVRHRAVAREADVPLSATTYYFKDIHQLIADAFTLYVERADGSFVKPLLERIKAAIGQMEAEGGLDRQELVVRIAQYVTDYVFDLLENDRDTMKMEMAFKEAALQDAGLAEMSRWLIEKNNGAIAEICRVIGTRNPEQDAIVIHGTINMIEYTALLKQPSEYESYRQEVFEQLKNLLQMTILR